MEHSNSEARRAALKPGSLSSVPLTVMDHVGGGHAVARGVTNDSLSTLQRASDFARRIRRSTGTLEGWTTYRQTGLVTDDLDQALMIHCAKSRIERRR